MRTLQACQTSAAAAAPRCECVQVSTAGKTLSRRARESVAAKEDEQDQGEPTQEEHSSSGERDVKRREMRKEGKKEKSDGWDSKEGREVKERKDVKPVEAAQRHEDSLEKVTPHVRLSASSRETQLLTPPLFRRREKLKGENE